MAIDVFGGGLAAVFTHSYMFQLLFRVHFNNPSVVKNKHAAFPVSIGVFMKVTYNSAVELPDIIKTFFNHYCRCFFTSYAPGAVGNNGFIL